MTLEYVREPGYIYDLFFVYALHFNKETLLNDIINHNNESVEKQYFASVLELFEPVPEELYLFFYMKDKSQTFITQYYFNSYEAILFDNYSFQTVMDALADYEQVKRNLLQFYFNLSGENSLKEYMSSPKTVCRHITASSYDDKIKCSLYNFFVDSDSVMMKLRHSLQSAEIKLSQYYEKNYQKILAIQGKLDIYALEKKLSGLGMSIALSSCNSVCVSMCLALKNCIKSLYDSEVLHLLIGWDYESSLDFLISHNNSLQLDVFGTALSEPNRVELFKLMHSKGEITIKDIEQTMKISGTNAYYHLMLMLKANIVLTRNEGRTIHYRINKNQMDVISKFLSQYGNNPLEVK